MYNYQQNNRYFAQMADSLKEIGTAELTELGAKEIKAEYRGLHFIANRETLYRINYSARLPSRILAPLISFDCQSTDELYNKGLKIPWKDFITQDNTLAIFSNVSHSTIDNSHFASLRLKDAIVDYFRKDSKKRPDIDTKNPDVWFNLYINQDQAIISLDTSGGSLHRRGFRKDAVLAPMQETLAAAIIRMSGWNGAVPLLDPMCGSGTLISEAMLHYCHIPSGFLRERFGFEFLPDFDKTVWQEIKKKTDLHIRPLPEGLITGNDISSTAIDISRNNLKELPGGEKIKLKIVDFHESVGLQNGVIISNPPYGIRMGKDEDLDLFYKSFGDFLKHNCKGSTAYIYFGERGFIKKIGLRSSWKKELEAGGLDGRLVKFEMY